MKKFNLEAAKAGAPVVTRDGRQARIICFDRKETKYAIIALIEAAHSSGEFIESFTSDGHYGHSSFDHLDLFMKPTKKEGWVVIYPNGKVGVSIHETREDAEYFAGSMMLGITKIEWEE